jgi:biotin carboxylase
MKKRILVLNPCPNRKRTLEVFKHEMNLEVTAVEKKLLPHLAPYVDNFIQADTLDHDYLLPILHEMHAEFPFDGIMTDRELFIETTAEIAKSLDLLSNSVETIRLARNKYSTRCILRDAGVPIPRFASVKTRDDLYEATKLIGLPVIFKPVAAASSEGVFKIVNAEEINSVYEKMNATADPKQSIVFRSCPYEFIAEEFMLGSEFSVEGVASHGEFFFAGVTEKWTTPEQFTEIQHCFPARISDHDRNTIISVVHDALSAIGWKHGGFHVEVMLTSSGPKIIEINGRLSGGYVCTHLVEIATGINIVRANCEAFLNLPVNFKATRHKAACTRFFIVNHGGIVKAWHGIDEAKKSPGVKNVMIESNVGSTVQLIQGRQVLTRLAAIITEGDTADEALHNAEIAIKYLNVDLAPL